jgi:hypothetical protein
MSDNVIQTSFSAGELSPNLNARVDFAKYRSGAATMRNFFVDYRSGASTRAGTEFIRPARYAWAASDPNFGKVRIIRFQQSTTVTFILEFGHGYLRFISQGSSIVESAIGITAVSHGPLCHLTVPGHNYATGDTVFVTAAAGIPQLSNRYYYVQNAVAGGFDILDQLTVTPVDSTLWDVYLGGGTSQRVYTITTPYTGLELSKLKFSQNASVMNITHPNHPPYKLQLFNATNWTLTPVTFGATIGPPVSVTVTGSGAGPAYYKYALTSVDDSGQESVPSAVVIASAVQDLRVNAGTNAIGWGDAGPYNANIYGSSPSYVGQGATVGGLGFMGTVKSGIGSFFDSNISPDFSQSPPVHDNPFAGVNPQCSSYFQQRLVYANGGGNLVETFWASRTGAPYNFDISNPPQADDAITAELVSLEVNEIKSLIPMPTGLIALTTNGAWQINGGAGGVATQGGPITPITITATPQAYIGANDVPPIVVNYDILFVQAKGSIVRDLTFNIYANIYTGNDISILSSHLFYGHQIVEWAYAEEPFKSIWCVREDGILLNLTLVKEQDMYGWSRHDTLGNFKSVASVTEGQNDATYVVVERPNPRAGFGNVMQIERIANREFPFGAEDAWCVDAGVTTVSNFPNSTLTVQNQYVPNPNLVTVPPVFTSDMVGWIVRVGGGILKIISVSDTQNAFAEILQEISDVIPNDPRNRPDNAPPGTWTLDKPGTKVYGLDHLEGQPVAVLADGGVVNGLVVHDGSVTLPGPATKVIAGYAFQAQLQTMPLDLGNEINSVQGKRKKVGALTVRVKDSRAVKAGMTFDTVTPIKELNRVTVMGLPIKLITADERIVMDPLWDVPGQICIQVDDPLPTTILGVIPEVVVGDGQK